MFHSRLVPFLAVGALLLAAPLASAQQHRHRLLNLEDFESYNLGSLDKNDPNGPNMADNGQGNPWFGPGPNIDLVVVGPENGVQPISGNQMVRGFAPSDFDQDWYNLAYRLNGGQPFVGNIILSWWFFDPVGPGNTDYKDYVALGFYDTAPPDTDAPPNYNLNVGFTQIQRLSLGGTGIQDGAFNPAFYQARVVGAQGGYNMNGDWFNTQTPRSVGWHHAAIHVGPLLPDGGNQISFYIDDGVNPTVVQEAPSTFTFGYNVIEMNAAFGPQTAYYDDVGFYKGKRHEVARIFGQ